MILRYFEMQGNPHWKGRPRTRVLPGTNRAIIFTPKEDKLYEDKVRNSYLYTYHGIPPLEKPVTVEIKAYYPIAKSVTRKNRVLMEEGKVLPVVKPDIDNVVKSVLDSLNGVAFVDDNHVVGVMAYKYYENNEHPAGIRVWIRTVDTDG